MAHHSSPTTHHPSHEGTFPSPGKLRRILAQLRDVEFTWQKPLAHLTTFRIGGPVACVARPLNDRALAALMEVVTREGIPRVVLGGGSNVLAPDDPWDVLVVQLDGSPANIVPLRSESEPGKRVYVGAGVKLSTLLRFCIREQLGGIEPLVGIPGTVGGALVMNAGTREGSIADPLAWVDLLDGAGLRRRIPRSELPAEYRCMGLPENATVLGACFDLRFARNGLLRNRMAETMKRRRENQPLGWPSAGCVFKNPAGVSAGALIDEAGLKGYRVGGAEVSGKHANWIINLGNAKAADVLALIRHVDHEVFLRFGIRLEREIRVLGPQGEAA